MNNNFKTGETILIESEVVGYRNIISKVFIEIKDATSNDPVISKTEMQYNGLNQYVYYWDTSSGYSSISAWSGYSSYPTSSGIYYSGYSGYSSYIKAVSGIYNCKIEAIDTNNYKSIEYFRIRVL